MHADAIVHLLMVHERGLGWDYRSRGGLGQMLLLYSLDEESGFLDPFIFDEILLAQGVTHHRRPFLFLIKSRFSIALNWQTQGLFQRQSDSPLKWAFNFFLNWP